MGDHKTQAKQLLRSSIRKLRKQLPDSARATARTQLASHAFELFQKTAGATKITCYLPGPGEPDTTELLEKFQQHSIPILLPVSTTPRELRWQLYQPGQETVTRSGMPEPKSFTPALCPDQNTLMLIPAAAADNSGNRLGWGGGYYDQALSKIGTTAGIYAILFEHEVLPELPIEQHDQKIDGVIVPSGTKQAKNQPN